MFSIIFRSYKRIFRLSSLTPVISLDREAFFMKKRSFLLSFILCLFLLSCSATTQKRSFGEVIDDAVITNKLKTKYVKDKLVKAGHINVDTWKGVVSLKGTVGSQEEIDRAIDLAERQVGVKEVKSYLLVDASRAGKPTKKDSIEEVDLTSSAQEKNKKSHTDGFVDDEESPMGTSDKK